MWCRGIGRHGRRSVPARVPTPGCSDTELRTRWGRPRSRVTCSARARPHELAPGRQRLGDPRVGRRFGVGGDGRRLDHVAQQGHRRRPVGHRVVELDDHGDPVVGQALDHPDGPQRPVAGQRRAGELGDGRGQGPVVARGVEHDPAQVAARGRSPGPRPRPGGRARAAPARPGGGTGAAGRAAGPAPRTGCRRRTRPRAPTVGHRHLDGVHVGGRRLRVEELGVQAGHGLHGHVLLARQAAASSGAGVIPAASASDASRKSVTWPDHR